MKALSFILALFMILPLCLCGCVEVENGDSATTDDTEATNGTTAPETTGLPTTTEITTTAAPVTTVPETTLASETTKPETTAETEAELDTEAVQTTAVETTAVAEHHNENDTKDIAALIINNLDTIMIGYTKVDTEQQLIDAHPDEFAEIVALGDEALPYLEELLKYLIGYISSYRGEPYKSYRCLITMAAAYAIKPELYDLEYPSPDGKYILKASINNFAGAMDPFNGINYNVNIIESETGLVYITTDEIYNKVDMKIKWSPDSRYATISKGYRHYYCRTDIFDIENAKFIVLPDKKEIEDILGIKLSYYDSEKNITFNYVHFYFGEWGTEDKIKIRIMLSSFYGGGVGDGWYIYDLRKGEIVDIKFEMP